jgi:DNA-directed RNA polymerase specialized sigma24 family protein
MNAFCFYLKELRRQRRGREQPGESVEDETDSQGDPVATFDREVALAFVRAAMVQAEQTCREEKLEQHWTIFLRHHLQGTPFQDIAREFGMDAARATVMSRTATRKFRAALRDIVARDGVSPEQIDDEIQNLMKEMSV